jgi:hypothetical protein
VISFWAFTRLARSLFYPIGPELGAAFRIDQLNIDLNMMASALYAAIENVAHPEFAPDLSGSDGFALVGERSRRRDHKAPRNAGQVGSEIVADRISEILLLRIVRQICEW